VENQKLVWQLSKHGFEANLDSLSTRITKN